MGEVGDDGDDGEENGEDDGWDNGEVLGAGVSAYAQTAPANTPKIATHNHRLDKAHLGALFPQNLAGR